MTLDMSKELPTMPTIRAAEWRTFWFKRIADYWSLGCVSRDGRW